MLPSAADLRDLTNHRDQPLVSMYLPSSPMPRETDNTRVLFRSTVDQAKRRLAASGVDKDVVEQIIAPLSELESDSEFWRRQAHTLAVFAGAGVLRAFRLVNRLPERLSIGDRFDIGALLRATTFANAAYVLALTEGDVQLYGISREEPTRKLELDLPDDLHTVLEIAVNEGRFDRQRAQGANGDRTEQQRFARIVQDAVLERVNGSELPLILSASPKFESAYRSVNTYPHLLERSIEPNPESLTGADLTERARIVLDELHRQQLEEWRQRYEQYRDRDCATGDLGHVAKAAAAGAVEELMFDIEAVVEGWIDSDGALHVDEGAGENAEVGEDASELMVTDAGAHGGAPRLSVLDDIACRVLRASGRVIAARAEDLPNGSPVAAMLRYPF
ncbi:hypothetical protein [Ruicaihuangia caeni]|uniref:Uncharacterized protein n=1 Tax=Ruicaihuangia caeni TaxID=3042517 RepID=A0AAW6TBN7_9MICO|nr:hypothetical protein [Klugiella sp. YN-L-19]MDI2099703.1 hypothetical protein [Klugiella sp. YN-L-19]